MPKLQKSTVPVHHQKKTSSTSKNFFLCLWAIFALLDLDPGTPLNPIRNQSGSRYGSGSTALGTMATKITINPTYLEVSYCWKKMDRWRNCLRRARCLSSATPSWVAALWRWPQPPPSSLPLAARQTQSLRQRTWRPTQAARMPGKKSIMEP